MTDSEPLVGIDLGTTNSLCAVFVDGEPRLVPNAHGGVLTPSVVGILPDGQILVGDAARELAVTRPERTAAWFKRSMGTDKRIEVAGKEFSSQELSSLVLRSLVSDAVAHLGRPVERAVITVPAYFNDFQREATRIAAQLADLEVQRIVNEPTAAALTYGLVDKDQDKKILVVDLGGGTFDVTLMEVFEGTLEINSTAGESRLGGEDFTDRVVDWALGHVDRVLEVAELKEPLRVARLRSQVEAAKRTLSSEETATIVMPEVDGTFADSGERIELSRAEFGGLVHPLIQRLEGPIARVLRDGRTTHDEVDEVILVGGATRMPILREYVTEWFGREPQCSLDPDKVVAKGAAVQAALIADDASVEEMVMTDVCPFTLGIEISKDFGNQRRGGYFMPVIHRNTTIPVSKEEIVYTIEPNQRRIDVSVYQGESRKVEDNLLLGEFEVDGIPPREAGAPVAIRFTYDLNGLLEVEAVVEDTGKKTSSLFTHHVKNLGKKEITKAVAALQELKFYPRENTGNQKLLLFGERIIGQVGRYDRPALEEALTYYEGAMRGNEPEVFDHARGVLLQTLSKLGFPYEED